MIFDHNKDDEASKNENFSTSIEENRSDSPKKAFSALAERIDNLQNFFVFQIWDIKDEIKKTANKRHQKKHPVETMTRLSFCKIQ